MLLFVVPMYRVSPTQWDEEFKKEYGLLLKKGEDYQLNRHYVHWRYNDVIAWIEISYEVFKIKGRIFTIDKKRYDRNFTGMFKSSHKIGDIDIHTTGRNNDEILQDIIDRMERFRKRAYPKRFIDTSVIIEGGKYIDFKKMYEDKIKNK